MSLVQYQRNQLQPRNKVRSLPKLQKKWGLSKQYRLGLSPRLGKLCVKQKLRYSLQLKTLPQQNDKPPLQNEEPLALELRKGRVFSCNE